MIVTKTILHDVHLTGQQMARLVSLYWSDLGAWLDRPFLEYYRFVCSLPYVSDPDNVETVSRPLFTLNPDYRPRDCDHKAVLLAAWWYGHGRPVRFVASSCKPSKTLGHVFIQVGDGLFFDATYNHYAEMLGNYPYFYRLTKLVPLTGWLK